MNTRDAPYPSERQVETLVRRFEACDLSLAEWNHRAHLTVAMWYLTHHPEERACERMIRGIRRFNHSNGIRESRRGGYHETLTLFWLGLGRRMIDGHPERSPLQLVNRYLSAPRETPYRCYSESLLWSCDARCHWVTPDLADLDEVAAELFTEAKQPA